MKVVFFRHGPAVPQGTPGVDEEERPLTPEGREKTIRAAEGLRELDLGLTSLYSSPLPRARQTAEILAEVLGLPRPKLIDVLRPETPARRLLQELRKMTDETPVLVGHEPMLSQSAALAAGGGRIELKKAGLALVEFEKLGPQPSGTLKLLLSPAALRRLAP